MKKLNKDLQAAILLGSMCSIAYFAVYIARNVLSAVTPQMIGDGYSEKFIGSISSLYFVTYAVGQLINGAIGDKIKARWMICIGLLGAGLTNFSFAVFGDKRLAATIAYAATGFFLSMIYAPLVKVVGENTKHIYAVRCNVGFTFASFLGSPTAGLLAAIPILTWQNTFTISSSILGSMAVICFIFFITLERKGIIKTNPKTETDSSVKNESKSYKILFKYQIIKYSFVSIITGILRTSVVFWLPTYINQYLSFSDRDSAKIYTVATLVISLTTFITIFIYELLGRKMNLTLFIMFVSSTVFFILVSLIPQSIPILNIIIMILAIMSSNGAATIMWSVYCPSLSETGLISTATGYLDFLSYMAAAIANIIFANAVKTIGWNNLLLVWLGIVFTGLLVALPIKRKAK